MPRSAVSSAALDWTGHSISTDSRTGRLFDLALAAQLSWRDFKAVYPPRIYLFTTLPRAVFQVAFFGYLGYYAAGEDGRTFATIGATAHIVVLATIVRAPDVLIDERVLGTLHRLRLGRVPLPAIVGARWGVFVAEGVVDAAVAIAIVPPVLGDPRLTLEILRAAPLLLIVAVTTGALGLAVAAVALTQRADVLLTNVTSYALLVFAGVVAPISEFGEVGSRIVRALPLTNGLLALRASIDGRPWIGDALLETAVGAAWLLLALALLDLQARRARRLGTDDAF